MDQRDEINIVSLNQDQRQCIENIKTLILFMANLPTAVQNYSEPNKMLVAMALAHGGKTGIQSSVDKIMDTYSDDDKKLIKLLSKRTQDIKTKSEAEFVRYIASITRMLIKPGGDCKC
jgi:hypothetical protein